jgi:hypothetical protein
VNTARVRRLAAFVLVAAGGLPVEAGAGELPKLEVTSTPPAPAAERARPPAGPTRARGTTLVLNSLSEERRRALAESLDRVAAQLEARRNPLYAPLEPDAPRAQLKALLLDVAPAFAAAETLSAGRWTSPEGDLTVRLVERCAEGAACFPLTTAAAREKLEERARFLAWPVGHAILLKARDAGDAARLASLLRGMRALEARVAMVLAGGDLHRLRPSPALTALERSARRALRAGGDHDELMARLLTSVIEAARAPDEVSWLKLPRDVVLIVPRLGALATADDFVHAVDLVVHHAGGATWLSSPR